MRRSPVLMSALPLNRKLGQSKTHIKGIPHIALQDIDHIESCYRSPIAGLHKGHDMAQNLLYQVS